jgi:hypothetical protein
MPDKAIGLAQKNCILDRCSRQLLGQQLQSGVGNIAGGEGVNGLCVFGICWSTWSGPHGSRIFNITVRKEVDIRSKSRSGDSEDDGGIGHSHGLNLMGNGLKDGPSWTNKMQGIMQIHTLRMSGGEGCNKMAGTKATSGVETGRKLDGRCVLGGTNGEHTQLTEELSAGSKRVPIRK